ncbi:hypothetical protein BDP81DRAFT_422242 [Colletotrichum phormii]|uniref:Uncharacterized protein n=1 Tax=Colletotrichum phormii TaxID=359342 RepID=A0AAI9ZXF6_9PEZI|nr:uncharacterized protein BDP81DRAFT_422242 [Colletotrichum phormii]KAK1639994.1 hypothetical protein BDP81DRAFT_422242 [Colletotrichum phormii]
MRLVSTQPLYRNDFFFLPVSPAPRSRVHLRAESRWPSQPLNFSVLKTGSSKPSRMAAVESFSASGIGQ